MKTTPKDLANATTTQPPPAAAWDDEWFTRYQAAMDEFQRTGGVYSVVCHECDGPVYIQEVQRSPLTRAVSCPCGCFTDTVKEV